MFPDHRSTFLDPPSTFLGPILDTRLPSQCRLLDPDPSLRSHFYFAHAQSEPRSSSPETEAASAEAALNSARETLKRARQRFHSTAIATEQKELFGYGDQSSKYSKGKKKVRPSPWTKQFYCLAYCNQFQLLRMSSTMQG